MTALAITPSEQGIPTGKYLYAGTGSQDVFRREQRPLDSPQHHHPSELWPAFL